MKLAVAITLLTATFAPARSAGAQFTSPNRTAAVRPTLAPALDSARAALDKYKDPLAALSDGYLSSLVCMDYPAPGKAGDTPYQAGAMGVHLLKAQLIGAPLDPRQPQVLIYEPHGDTLQLVAAEWFVPVAASAEKPVLFGQPFDGPMDGHPPIMPASLRHWDLHVWMWRANPAGVFSPTNASVRCPAGPLRLTPPAAAPR